MSQKNYPQNKTAPVIVEVTLLAAFPIGVGDDSKRRKRVLDGLTLVKTDAGVMVTGPARKKVKGMKVDANGNGIRTVLVPWSQIQYAVIDD